jgi:hypothetical protein
MYKAIYLACLAAGVTLVIFGINASQSRASDISRFFNGSPTDKTMWLLVGGGALFIVGLVGTLRGSKAST